MRSWELAKGAAQALRANRLRTSLTTLGIVIGVGAVVAMMALTSGLEKNFQEEFRGLGSDTFQIDKHPAMTFGGDHHLAKYRKRKDLTPRHADAIREGDEFARSVGVEAWNFGGKLRSEYATTSQGVFVVGASPEWAVNSGAEIAIGRMISGFDVEHERNVIVLGSEIAQTLFPNASPLERSVLMRNQRFTVVGVFAERGSFMGMESRDGFALIPVSVFMKTFGEHRSVEIAVQAFTMDTFEQAKDRATLIMRQERRLKPEQENDFEVFTNQSILDKINELTDSIRFSGLGIAIIALLVGGIGIMNIMIVSVTERTREIGVRMAVGAKRRHILFQFTVEAVLLSLLGGLLGLGFGLGVAQVVSLVTPIPAVAPVWAVIAAVGMSSFTGLTFGIYPAWRASRLDPIESLRYE